MPEDVTIINNGGDIALGIVTNLVVSGYAKFGSDRGTLFSPDGDQQVSGTLITYRNLIGRGGIYAGDVAASNYTRGSFLRGNIESGDAVIDGSGLDYVLLGSGLLRGPVLFQDPQITIPPTATIQSQMPLHLPQISIGADFSFSAHILAVTGSGFFSGPVCMASRAGWPNDRVFIEDMPLYVGPTAVSTHRVMASGEVTAGSTHVLNTQPGIVNVENAGSALAYSYQVLANTLGARGGVEVEWFGHYLNSTGAAHAFGVSLKYGTETWATATLSGVPSDASGRTLRGRALLTAAGSTSTQRVMLAHAVDVPNTVSGTGTGTAGAARTVSVTNPYVAVDSTTAQDVVITFLHDATDPNLRASVFSVFTRKL